MKLSIITSLYRSEPYIELFLEKAITAGEAYGGTFEIIVVDDGSPDGASGMAKRYADKDDRIRVIELSRNFGHHPAFWCGMHHARGEWCFLIDSDLEVDPAVLADFKKQVESTEADVVYGVQAVRQGAARTRVFGGMFWKVFNVLSDINVPADIMTERLLSRRYLNALLSMGDYNMFLGAMYHWPGFTQVPLPLTKTPRMGRGAYSLLDRVRLLVEAVSSFSSAPLTLIFWLGSGISVLSLVYSGYLLLRRLLFPASLVDGFTFLALVLVGGVGAILMALGVIGIYIHRIFKQVQHRPVFIVKNIYPEGKGVASGRS